MKSKREIESTKSLEGLEDFEVRAFRPHKLLSCTD